MALSSPAQRRRLPLLLLALLLAALSSPCARAATERGRALLVAPAALPPAGRACQEFRVAPPTVPPRPAAGVSMNGGAAGRPIGEWRRRVRRGRGGGTGAWTFSAMLPRGFVPPSGSSACHNDMPATAANAQFFACGGAGAP